MRDDSLGSSHGRLSTPIITIPSPSTPSFIESVLGLYMNEGISEMVDFSVNSIAPLISILISPITWSLRTAIGVLGNQGYVDDSTIRTLPGVRETIHVSKPYKMVSRYFHPESSVINVSGVKFGDGHKPVIIAGPCSIETEEQMMTAAKEVKAGGGSFHHGGTWHGSGANNGLNPRRSLVLHAMPSEVEYVPKKFNQGIGPIYSRYKRLGDNMLDENYFPILWREDGYRTSQIEDYLK